MNTIIQNLMDFLSPDTYLTPNPLVNVLALTIISLFIGLLIVKIFFQLIITTDIQIPIKQKLLNYITFTLVTITLVLLFFPLYNILRTVMNPELMKSLIN